MTILKYIKARLCPFSITLTLLNEKRRKVNWICPRNGFTLTEMVLQLWAFAKWTVWNDSITFKTQRIYIECDVPDMGFSVAWISCDEQNGSIFWGKKGK